MLFRHAWAMQFSQRPGEVRTRSWRRGHDRRAAARRFKPARRGISMIELLVAIGIVALLLSIALPAIVHLREAGRRTPCASNLKQFGLAILQYEAVHRVFPPGGTHPGSFLVLIFPMPTRRICTASFGWRSKARRRSWPPFLARQCLCTSAPATPRQPHHRLFPRNCLRQRILRVPPRQATRETLELACRQTVATASSSIRGQSISATFPTGSCERPTCATGWQTRPPWPRFDMATRPLAIDCEWPGIPQDT